MMRVAICDDNGAFLNEMKEEVSDFFTGRNINFHVSVFKSGEDLLVNIENTGVYDIIFLDIELASIDGIETAGILREKYPMLLLIFISCHTKYYKQAFDVHPYQFLCKPINSDELHFVCENAVKLIINNMEKINFCSNGIYYCVKLGDIMYLESQKRVVRLVCEDGIYDFYEKLGNVEKYLESKHERFLRIHNSYLVNTNYIKEFKNDYIIMSNGEELLISRDRKKNVKEYFFQSIKSREN